jgi:hypothetical protein
MMTMRAVALSALALFVGMVGCGGPLAPSATLVGTVVRGPIQPVCQITVPCEAPFSGGFTAQQGGRVAASFRSDSQGHFDVQLAAGNYVVVPDADAPMMSPKTQAKDVVVGATGPTTVVLHFDTGIR